MGSLGLAGDLGHGRGGSWWGEGPWEVGLPATPHIGAQGEGSQEVGRLASPPIRTEREGKKAGRGPQEVGWQERRGAVGGWSTKRRSHRGEEAGDGPSRVRGHGRLAVGMH